MRVRTTIAVAGAGVVAWTVAPFVSMHRRGTLDEQAVAAWQDEGLRTDSGRAHRRRSSLRCPSTDGIPTDAAAGPPQRSAREPDPREPDPCETDPCAPQLPRPREPAERRGRPEPHV